MATHVSSQSGGNDDVTEMGGYESESILSERVVVGIPTYNEEIAVGSIILDAQRYASEVVVVDDGSTDNTVQIAENAGATVIEHEKNRGKGGAIRTLLEYVDDDELDGLVLLDGDGQHIPGDIPDVAEPVLNGACDVAIGSRYVGQEQTETPLYRRVGQRVLDLLTLGSAGKNLTDTQSGFRTLSPKAISRLNLRTDGMGIESEMISEAMDQELVIEEVPIDVRYEGVDGQTYNPLQHGLAVAVFILQLIRDRHPLFFFGVPGAIGLIVGGLVALHTAWLYQTTGAFHQWRVLLSGFTILVSVLAAFGGLILNQMQNMIQQINE